MQESRRALSLIEVCVAIVIVSLVLVSMLGIFGKGYQYLRKTRTRTGAYNLAKGIMEQYSNWTTLDALDGVSDSTVTSPATYTDPAPSTPDPSNPFDSIPLNNVTYTPQLIISDVPIDPTRLKQINLTISWTEGAVNRNVTIYTLKANY